MRKFLTAMVIVFAGILSMFAQTRKPDEQAWAMNFDLGPGELTNVGRNPYYILEPGYVLVLEGGNERLTIAVLNETRTVGNVETRIVEEREMKAGQTVEVSRNYFAISARTNNVYYFGEDVDMYKAGKITSHEGAWLAGVNGARFGLMMPGAPALRDRYYQEIAPGVAMDRAEIVSLNATLKTRAGKFDHVLKTVETTPLEPGVAESKYYAPGVGLIQDGSLKLVKYEKGK